MERRRFGSVRRLTSNQWQARYTVNGTRRGKTFASQAEAEKWLKIESQAAAERYPAVSPRVAYRIARYLQERDEQRGDWPDARAPINEVSDDEFPSPPFPAVDNPLLAYIINQGETLMYQQDGNLHSAIRWAIFHAWMEGHIEGYDRAHSEIAGQQS